MAMTVDDNDDDDYDDDDGYDDGYGDDRNHSFKPQNLITNERK